MIEKGNLHNLTLFGMLRQKQQTIQALERVREINPEVKTTVGDFKRYKRAGDAWESQMLKEKEKTAAKRTAKK